ncbi:conserved hypothetical protein [Aspergillus terreus NIH2624]|uniref:F-box domain-containing protein n=1 Tax=Aspergillus terreus (strain NIH 2624 / FGSC A1156) TaxID=341663 RepID=Q0C8Y1_ASPTN|nr:uncharacterized protein ATEG_09853 [Aspergillus terreus NIH2624]EAU30044.1 conserved hypothetical protein [Aspergillus terreus NIH2624]
MEDNAELESFRRQWREEVARRTKQNKPSPSQSKPSASTTTRPPTTQQFPPTHHEASQRKGEDDGDGAAATLDQGEIIQGVSQLSLHPPDDDAFNNQVPRKEPKSALEHFERAVEKEAEGNLGDSLQLYRKAYRLDAAVDKTYRNKHFAWAWKKSAQAAASSASAPSAAQKPQDESETLPTPELIASFANLPIPQAEPEIENTPPPPCPIANVPSEVIVEILRHIALMDPAAFCRMALVCKRLAYHFAHEQHIWKRLCQGSEFGFKAMHYSFACDIYGRPEHTLAPRFTPFPTSIPAQIPQPLSSWSEVFQIFPRIRFTGIYISTVNYTRPGAASSYQNISWGSPIHIVTYYRYIRFYRDGTVIYLLTTEEPLNVVPHISKENVKAARATSHKQHQRQLSDAGTTVTGAPDPVPPVAMAALKYAQFGRWRLSKPLAASDPEEPQTDQASGLPSLPGKTSSDGPDPRDVIVETEVLNPKKYICVLHLSLRSTSASSRPNSTVAPPNTSKNTKLVWKGYWSYNKMTDDWTDFSLRNERAFVFRRVRGWDMSS